MRGTDTPSESAGVHFGGSDLPESRSASMTTPFASQESHSALRTRPTFDWSLIDQLPIGDRAVVIELCQYLRSSNITCLSFFYMTFFARLSDQACRDALIAWSYKASAIPQSHGMFGQDTRDSHSR